MARFMVKLAFGLMALVLPAIPADAAPPAADPSLRAAGGQAVSDIGKPINQRFPNLDAYLAYLEKGSHMDKAWYREVRPGVYELQTGNLRRLDEGQRQRVFTREELERKFGFAPGPTP
jgi:hypothetical protein